MARGIQIIDPQERFSLELEGAKLVLRRIDSETLMALERRVRGGAGRGGEAGRAERERLNDEVLDYVLLDWQGVSSPLDGSEVPCTAENKRRLPAAVKLKILAAAQRPWIGGQEGGEAA